MGWVQLVALVIAGAVLATVSVWQVWSRIVKPLIDYVEPAVQEITGGKDERVPGIRAMLTNLAAGQHESVRATNNLSAQVQQFTGRYDAELQEVRRDAKENRARLGAVEVKVDLALDLIRDTRATAEGTPVTRGEPAGDSPPPPRSGTLVPDPRRGKG